MSDSLHPFLATGWALVDGDALQDNGVCIGLAVLKSTALALCLRKQGEQLLSLNFFFHDWSGAALVLRLSISALFLVQLFCALATLVATFLAGVLEALDVNVFWVLDFLGTAFVGVLATLDTTLEATAVLGFRVVLTETNLR